MKISRIISLLANEEGYKKRYNKGYNENILVHVSDTPLLAMGYIKRLMEKIKAKYLIHTGDFIDEIKTTHPLFEMKDYERSLKKFIKKLDSINVDEIYLIPGNHDDLNLLESFKNRFNIVQEGTIIKIKGVSFSVAHDFQNLKMDNGNGLVFYLYGHNRLKRPEENFLNGYCSINIVLLNNLKVYKIPYPFYVDIVRGKNRMMKIGL